MQDGIDSNRVTRSRGAWLLAVTALVSGVLVAGCGGSSSSTTAGTVGAQSTSASTTAPAAATTTSSASSPPPGALTFARCMRSNGVSNFPDPTAGGGLVFPANGVSPSSPAFKTAQARCRKFLPNGGPPGPGSTTHPSAQTLAKLVRIAECMRQHGVTQFPDPRTSVPSDVTGEQEITDFDGVILLFPSTLNLQSPAYKQDLDACGAPPLGLKH